MTSTATRTRTTTDVATWGTWKDHGHAAVLGYMGRDRKQAGMAVRVVKVTSHNGSVLMHDIRTSELVARSGAAGRFWATPATFSADEHRQVPPNDLQHRTAGELVTEDAKAIQRAARPSRNSKLHACKCGCNGQVKGLYRQGHDARHASQVAKAVIARMLADPDEETSSLILSLPTEALRAKAAHIVARRIK